MNHSDSDDNASLGTSDDQHQSDTGEISDSEEEHPLTQHHHEDHDTQNGGEYN